VFDAADTLDLMVAAMTGMVRDMVFNEKRMRSAASTGFSTATDLADWLVRELNIPFRDAHHITGKAVALAEGKNIGLEKLTLADMQSIHEGITQDVFSVLTVEKSVRSRTSFGGTAPSEVKKQIATAKRKLAKE
jgi:argininosuccinate lyase